MQTSKPITGTTGSVTITTHKNPGFSASVSNYYNGSKLQQVVNWAFRNLSNLFNYIGQHKLFTVAVIVVLVAAVAAYQNRDTISATWKKWMTSSVDRNPIDRETAADNIAPTVTAHRATIAGAGTVPSAVAASVATGSSAGVSAGV